LCPDVLERIDRPAPEVVISVEGQAALALKPPEELTDPGALRAGRRRLPHHRRRARTVVGSLVVGTDHQRPP